MKKRMLIILITVLMIGAVSFQAIAKNGPVKEDRTAQSDEKPAPTAKKEKAKSGVGTAHTEEEFVLLDSLKKKKTELEEQVKVQEEGITPSLVEIPSMDIDTNVIPVGLLENGEMEVPEETDVVGWYDRGVKVGAKGNAVLAGHVDSKKGPAIFFYLKNIEIGEKVIVTDEKGMKRTYEVKSKESYPSDEAPIEKIFGPTDKRNLNIITCTGTFNHDEHLYPDRLVVYTELVSETSSNEPAAPQPPVEVKFDTGSISWHSVKDNTVMGYRVYKKSAGKKDYEHIASVSAHERKSVFDESAKKGDSYFVTTVNIQNKESSHSEKVEIE
ncbi:sortase domain-containing protein [Lysinibacillus sphaericus]